MPIFTVHKPKRIAQRIKNTHERSWQYVQRHWPFTPMPTCAVHSSHGCRTALQQRRLWRPNASPQAQSRCLRTQPMSHRAGLGWGLCTATRACLRAAWGSGDALTQPKQPPAPNKSSGKRQTKAALFPSEAFQPTVCSSNKAYKGPPHACMHAEDGRLAARTQRSAAHAAARHPLHCTYVHTTPPRPARVGKSQPLQKPCHVDHCGFICSSSNV